MIKPRTLLATSLSLCLLSGTMLLGAGGLFLSSQTCPAEEVRMAEVASAPVLNIQAHTFPRAFTGSFNWNADAQGVDHQTTRLRVEEVNQRGTLIVATGRGQVDFTHDAHDEPVEFDFRMEVDTMTGEFEMWESNPSTTQNYVIEGKYTAKLDSNTDFDLVHATWRGDNGMDGTLELRRHHLRRCRF